MATSRVTGYPGAPTRPTLWASALRAVLIVFVVLSGFELAKVLVPSLSFWPSRAITILFSSGLAGTIVFQMLSRYKRGNDQINSIEARYRSLFESSPTGAYLTSENGRILDCNISFCRIFGYSRREELTGLSMDRFFPNGAERSFYVTQLKNGKCLENVEHRLLRKDGREVWVLHSAVAIPCESSSEGRATRGTIVDITGKRQAEYKEQRLAAIARCSGYAVIALTPDGIIEAWNHGAEQMFGYAPAEVLGRSIGIIAPPEKHGEYLGILDKVKSGADVEIETVRRNKDGQLLDVGLSVSPIRGHNGDLIGVAAIIRDIRDRKCAERALLQSEAQYRFLFKKNPVPMWVFDRETLLFLAVNKAATQKYGYTEDEFLKMTIAEIRPESSVPALLTAHHRSTKGFHRSGEWQHRTRDGRIIDVEIVSHTVEFEGKEAELVAVYDITERNQAEEAAWKAEQNYRSIFDNAVLGMFQADLTGRPLTVNQALANIHGFESPDQMLNEITDAIGQLFVEPASIASQLRGLKSTEVRNAEANVYRRDKSQTRVRMNLRASRDSEGRPIYVEGMVEDIGEQRRIEAALALKAALLEAQTETTLDGILAVDRDDRVLLVNHQFARQFGISEEVLQSGNSLPVRSLLLEQIENPVSFIESVNHVYNHPDEKSRDEIRLKNGRVFDRYSAPLIDLNGRNWGRIWYFREITERKAAEEQIRFLAYYDALTGLPNRALLNDRLENAIAAARRRSEKVALVHIDLDRFKLINDSFGHAEADRVLQRIAERIRASLREADTVARTEGDGFLVILNEVLDLAEAGVAVRRIRDSIEASMEIEKEHMTVTASIGIAVCPDHGATTDVLLKNAELAMYGAKESGRNSIRFFSSEINGKALEQLAIEGGLRTALERNELFLVYQPQLELATGRVVGMEALLRWRHPDLGLIPPDKFIPVAERNGQIVGIGEWVLKTACEQTRKWKDEGLAVVPVAVNVSAIQFRSEEFASRVREVLLEVGLAPELLELELTESMLLSHAGAAHESVRELQAAGIKIAIDDFGTGYSSLSYLKQLRVNKLKIDRSFVKDLPGDRDDQVITQAIIGMARSLNLTVIAEGVETDEQVLFLRQHACDQIQGYWFSKPALPEEVVRKLEFELVPSSELRVESESTSFASQNVALR